MHQLTLQLPKSLTPGNRLLVAVSGGLDSVVLLHLLHTAGLELGVAHANFGLRGTESDEDEAFVAALSKNYEVSFFSSRFETPAYAQAKGISIQMAARDMRYAWFAEICEQHHFDFLATAHNLNDSLETAILNLVRGTGPAGLAGIVPTSGNLLRPMVNCSRQQIAEYASANHLQWREDSSNASDYYKRNFLRHHVIPKLRELNPNLLETFKLTQQRMADATAIVAAHTHELARKAVTQTGGMMSIRHSLLPAAGLPLVLHQLLKTSGYSYAQALQISGQLAGDHIGRKYLSPTHRLIIDRDELLIEPFRQAATITPAYLHQTTKQLDTPLGTLKATSLPRGRQSFSSNTNIALLDSRLLEFPLVIRPWQQGDSFVPLGMRGRKKLSDFLIDLKMPLPEKEKVLVLESGSEIAWVLGYRISDKFKITPQTELVLQLNWDPVN